MYVTLDKDFFERMNILATSDVTGKWKNLGRASIFGDTTLLSQDLYHSGSTSQNMNYTLFQNEFIADASTTTLRFTHLDTPTFGRGLALDAVSVTPVPEPAPMLLLALGGAACVVWRKRHLA